MKLWRMKEDEDVVEEMKMEARVSLQGASDQTWGHLRTKRHSSPRNTITLDSKLIKYIKRRP